MIDGARDEGHAAEIANTMATMPQTNILIVEDDLTTQEMARMVLENAGYGVSVARSAEDAERMLRSQWPDIVLMDRELPGMDGLEFTRRLKQAEETQGITIISFSSRQSAVDNEQAVAAGSDGFIHKPFTVRGLLQTVAWHVAARAARKDTGTSGGGMSPRNSLALGEVAWQAPMSDKRRMDVAAHLFGGFMNMSRNIIITGLLVVAAAASAGAQTATQSVGYQVNAINQIAVTGTPTLTITTAVAGSAPTAATSTGHTWAVTTNQTGAKITASIPTAMPAGVTLSATMAAPSGATSTGAQALSTTAVDLVTGITKLNATGLSLSYQLDATSAAGVVTGTRLVTYTITGGV